MSARYSTRCPEAVYGDHGAPNTSGNCPYCGLRIGARHSGASKPDDILDTFDVETDPVTLEPVSWWDREQTRRERRLRELGLDR